MFGGWAPTQFVPGSTGQLFNDMYALDVTKAITNAANQGTSAWTLVSPTADATGVTPGYPSPRVGYSWTALNVGAVLYGGLSRRDNTADPFQCIAWPGGASPSPAPSDCIWHHHVYVLLPGSGNSLNGPSPLPNPIMPALAWRELNSFTGMGGNVPAPRALHTAGYTGDQVYIYGGLTAAGPSQEMWAFNLVSETWAAVTQQGSLPTGLGEGVGCMIGRHFYWYEVARFGPEAVGTGQLYSWTPSSGAPPPPGAAGVAATPSNSGSTAGFVIAILIGLANLYILVLIAQGQSLDLLPSWLSSATSCLPSFGGGAPKASAPGGAFYTAATANGEYTAPSM
jgi:hypothetical protein